MPITHLDDNFAKRVARPEKGHVEYYDDKIGNYAVRVYADRIVGTLRARPLGSAKKKRFPLGEYPAITMAEMRRKAEAVRGKYRDGADPAAEREAIREKRRQEEKNPPLDFDRLCDLYIARLPELKGSWEQDRGYINRDCRPAWGKRLAASITTADCATRLLEIAKRAPVAANRVRSASMKLFGWAVEQGLLDFNPMAGTKKPTRERKEGVDRTLSDAEFVVLWRAIETATLAPGLRAALQVLALTGQRPNEIAGLALSELRHLDDPSQALAEIPAERMKGRRRHVVPLASSVVSIIEREITRQTTEAKIEDRAMGDHVFTSRFLDRERIARHSLSQALRRIIPALDATGEDGEIIRRLQADPPTPHAFRRTCASGMARLGIPREDRKAVLAHREDDVLGDHYDSYDRLREKRIALEAWARHCDALLSGKTKTGAVVPIRAVQS
ncbi:tyrosine-type recombinase/integrase [Rhizobium mulingense]|uniref:tyrosine-type recombinase/integrase n=1 Tax=Rhizobium mulingense TaxID=3031128 RepID=UPI002B463170|nr:tyrosine-type recombinase/integrase [Rhizobium sp. MJ21]MEB3047040.1 tyrosine-type recombinase/integrase [Rhizobium sp. MJ21]